MQFLRKYYVKRWTYDANQLCKGEKIIMCRIMLYELCYMYGFYIWNMILMWYYKLSFPFVRSYWNPRISKIHFINTALKAWFASSTNRWIIARYPRRCDGSTRYRDVQHWRGKYFHATFSCLPFRFCSTWRIYASVDYHGSGSTWIRPGTSRHRGDWKFMQLQIIVDTARLDETCKNISMCLGWRRLEIN